MEEEYEQIRNRIIARIMSVAAGVIFHGVLVYEDTEPLCWHWWKSQTLGR
jgi:hypothetical protein